MAMSSSTPRSQKPLEGQLAAICFRTSCFAADLEGGRLKSTLEFREAQQQEAAIAYHKTVLQAGTKCQCFGRLWTETKNGAPVSRPNRSFPQALRSSRARYANGVADS